MQFSDITNSINDVWSFAWPLLVICSLAYLIANYTNAGGTSVAIQRIVGTAKEYGSRLNELQTVLEPYGLTKLVPIISALLVIGFMYLLNGNEGVRSQPSTSGNWASCTVLRPVPQCMCLIKVYGANFHLQWVPSYFSQRRS
jgi:hypothetical protein